MTTNIETALEIEEIDENIKLNSENLPQYIMDLSIPTEKRIEAMENHYICIGDNSIEIISILNTMYQLGGSNLIESFFIGIAYSKHISCMLKIEAVKNILEYEEDEDIDDEEMLEHIQSKNLKRKNKAYDALNHICSNFTDISTPYRITAITILMCCDKYREEVNKYFCCFVNDQKIECDFRYKTILSLENLMCNMIKNELIELWDDQNFVVYIYDKINIKHQYPKGYNIPKTYKFWYDIIMNIDYDLLRMFYMEKFNYESCVYDYFIKNAHYEFINEDKNLISYRILSGQYLLQKCCLNEVDKDKIQLQLLNFAQNDQLEYDRRADSADILLSNGTKNYKEQARDIIRQLGSVQGIVRTVFDNAQNVHIEKIDESVTEIIEFLSTIPLLKINNSFIDFNYVKTQIDKILKSQKLSLKKENSGKNICSQCENNMDKYIIYKELKFCSQQCVDQNTIHEKIQLSLNRIYMDRALYTKFNNSLSNVLLKIWTYIINNDHEEEMLKRLLQELEEMSGTCSTGFVSRLINVISGFGQFNMRISFEDQIISNFVGRLNACARKINSPESPFRDKYLYDMMELWLNHDDNKQLWSEFVDDKTKDSISSTRDKIDLYLTNDKEKKIDISLSDFSMYVLDEMLQKSSNSKNRQNFSLFFRTYVGLIREEMYQEFKEYLGDTDFDLYMRKAIMSYDGEL